MQILPNPYHHLSFEWPVEALLILATGVQELGYIGGQGLAGPAMQCARAWSSGLAARFGNTCSHHQAAPTHHTFRMFSFDANGMVMDF
jgi:hypothetical protein